LLTGCNPHRTGMLRNGYPLPSDIPSLADLWKKAGAQTWAVGKLHLRPEQEGVPEAPFYGFDGLDPVEDHTVGPYLDWALERFPEYRGYWIGTLFNLPTNPDYWKGRLDLRGEVEKAREQFVRPLEISSTCNWGFGHYSPLPEEAHKNTWIADRACEALRRRDPDRPFFLWVGFVDPHNPFDPPGRFQRLYDPDEVDAPAYRGGEEEGWQPHHRSLFQYTGRFTERDWRILRALYYGSVTFMDEQIGRILAEVERCLDMQETIVVYTSDHGDLLGDHRIIGKTAYHYDGGVRVPLLLRWDGHWEAGKSSNALVETSDIAATLLVAAGLSSPGQPDGRSFHEVLEGRSDRHRDFVLIESFQGAPEDRTPAPANWARSIRTTHWRATFYPDPRWGELYDLKNDPDETRNLFKEPAHRATLNELREHLVERLLTVNYPLRPPPYSV